MPGRPSSSAAVIVARPACSRRCLRRRPGTRLALPDAPERCTRSQLRSGSRAAHPGSGRAESSTARSRPGPHETRSLPAAADQQVDARFRRAACRGPARPPGGRAPGRPTAGHDRARPGAGRGLPRPTGGRRPQRRRRRRRARLPRSASAPAPARARQQHGAGALRGAQKPRGGRRDDIRSCPAAQGGPLRASLSGRAQPKVHEGANRSRPRPVP